MIRDFIYYYISGSVATVYSNDCRIKYKEEFTLITPNKMMPRCN